MAEQLKNSLDNPTSTLASSITAVATSLTVASGHGTRFPATGTFRVKLTDQSAATLYELVICTARTTDTLTVTRAGEGTAARAFITGDYVDLVLSAAALTAYVAETAYVVGGTDVAVADGGTGASTAAVARTNLDVPSNAEAILDAIVDAKGDLIAASAADTVARLAVGANNQVLTADSAQATGIKWAAAAGGGSVATDAIWDVKGDIVAASAADSAARLAVGTNGQVLTADSVQTLGVKWAAAAGGGAVATDVIWDTKGDLAAATGADAAVKVPSGANDTLLIADSAQTAGLKYAKLANAQVDAAAAIVYSKLNLASSVVTGDVVDGTLTTADMAWSPIYYAGLNGFLATNFDPHFCIANTRPTTGYIYMAAVPIPRQVTIANIVVAANLAGVGLTTGQNLVGLYNSAGTLLGKSADQSTAWLSTGMPYTIPISVEGGQSLTQGGAGVVLYVAILSVGTTTPAFVNNNAAGFDGHNFGRTEATFRGAYFSTGSQTSLPTSMTMTNRTSIIMYWAAVS